MKDSQMCKNQTVFLFNLKVLNKKQNKPKVELYF